MSGEHGTRVRFCSGCGEAVDFTIRRCPSCGHHEPLSRPVEAGLPAPCPHCGKAVPSRLVFCPACGAERGLGVSEATSPSPPGSVPMGRRLALLWVLTLAGPAALVLAYSWLG